MMSFLNTASQQPLQQQGSPVHPHPLRHMASSGMGGGAGGQYGGSGTASPAAAASSPAAAGATRGSNNSSGTQIQSLPPQPQPQLVTRQGSVVMAAAMDSSSLSGAYGKSLSASSSLMAMRTAFLEGCQQLLSVSHAQAV